MEEVENMTAPEPVTSEWLREHTKIRGWLSFMLGVLGLAGVVSAVLNIVQFDSSVMVGSIADVSLGVACMGLAFYAIYAFKKRLPNAVTFARTYFVLVIVSNILVLCLGGTDETSAFTRASAVLRNVIYGVLWLCYLQFSKQVKEVIPPSFRHSDAKSVCAIIIAVMVPVCLVIVSVLDTIVTNGMEEYKQQEFVSQLTSDRQRTDGTIIFTIPNGFNCDSVEVNSEELGQYVIFNLEDPDTGLETTVFGDYREVFDQEYFDHCWDANLDRNYLYEVIDQGSCEINSHMCLYRRVRYTVAEESVFWDYYLLWDAATMKVAVVHTFEDGYRNSYILPLLESIIF